MKEFVMRLDLQDDKEKRKALKTVSALSGINEISIDMKGKKLKVIGTVDPISVATKLRKFWPTNIILVGPVKESEKKEDTKKKEDPKGEVTKKYEEKIEPPKQVGEKKIEDQEHVVGTVMPFKSNYPPMQTYYYMHHSIEENPNACVIS